ncbi:MAG: alpha/beta hydrolase, partial [Pseudomonadota bacterium]
MSCTHGTPAARAAVILIALFVAGCSSFALVNAASPNRYYERAESIAYGPAERQRLDVYRPDERPDSAPVVVFFYGGGWREGRRRDYEFVGSALSRAGFVTVIPDYRLYPEVRFPTFVEDGAAALAWVAENVAAHGGDRNAVHVMGHSAGAHIAAMLALNRRYVVAAGAPCLTIAGFVELSGPYDFLPIKSGYLTDVFP